MQILRLYSPNHVCVIVWQSTGLHSEEIKLPTTSLTLEVVYFYNRKSAMKFNNSAL